MTVSRERVGKPCLATVTSESFFPGTLVMIHSFLKYNPWFKEVGGEIVLFHDGLPVHLQQMGPVFEGVAIICLQVSPELVNKVNIICTKIPELKLEPRKKRFYSLEVFSLSKYSTVLFCDSDILFMASVSELFTDRGCIGMDDKKHLAGGGDFFYFSGLPIDAETFLPLEGDASEAGKRKCIENTFNAGFLLIDSHYLTHNHYLHLLELLDIRIWSKVKSPRTDQVVLNLYFQTSCHILSARYNYLVLHADLISQKEQISSSEIKVLHFNGRAKPWEHLKLIEASSRIPGLTRFVQLWYREYLDFLSKNQLLVCINKDRTPCGGTH